MVTLAILFLTVFCSSNSHLTELVGFENSTNGDHFYASPSGESLNIIKLIVGADSNVTFDVQWSVNLTEHGCRHRNTLKLKNRFVIECEQETLGGSYRKLLEVTNSPPDKWQVHPTTIPGRMNEDASMVAIYNHQWYYIFAQGGKLCFKGSDEQDISCSQVCENILKITSENSSSEFFTIACKGPGEYDNFVTKYSRAEANSTDFKMSYPPHVHRFLFATRNWTVLVGTRSMSILDNNHIDGGFRYCSSPSKDEIISGFVKGSYLFLTVENRGSQNIKIVYATYQYDLSMRTCVGRKLEGDGCIAYDSHFTNKWLFACPVGIGKYQYKLVTDTNPNVTILPTSSPTMPLSTISTTGEARANNSTETLPTNSTIMVSTTSETPGSANNGTSTSIVPTSSSHFTENTVPVCETPTIDTVNTILPWEYIIIILLILVIIVLILVLVCAPCCPLRYVRFLNRKQADYISPSLAEERVKKVPFETDTTRGESPFKSVEEKACTLDKSNQQSPPHSIASLQSSGITPQQSEFPQTSGPTHGRGTITVTANLESHCFQPIHAPTSIPQQSGRTETSEPTFGTGLLGVTPNLEARPFQPALSESSASTQQLSRLPENNKTNIGTEALKLMSSPKPHHLQLTNSESPPFDRTTIKNGISAQFDDSQTCILSRTDPTPQVVRGFKPTMPVSQEPSSHSLSTKDPPASSKVDEPDTKDPPASCKVDEPDAEDPPTSCKVDEPGTKDPLASCKVDEPDAEDPPTSSKERLLDTEELPSPIPEVGPSHQYNGDSDITLYLSSNLRAAYKPDGLSESHQ